MQWRRSRLGSACQRCCVSGCVSLQLRSLSESCPFALSPRPGLPQRPRAAALKLGRPQGPAPPSRLQPFPPARCKGQEVMPASMPVPWQRTKQPPAEVDFHSSKLEQAGRQEAAVAGTARATGGRRTAVASPVFGGLASLVLPSAQRRRFAEQEELVVVALMTAGRGGLHQLRSQQSGALPKQAEGQGGGAVSLAHV